MSNALCSKRVKQELTARQRKLADAVLAAYHAGSDTVEVFGRSLRFAGAPDKLETLLEVVLDGHRYSLAVSLEAAAKLAAGGYLGGDLKYLGNEILQRAVRQRRRQQEDDRTRAKFVGLWPDWLVDKALEWHYEESMRLQRAWRANGAHGRFPWESESRSPVMAATVTALISERMAGRRVPVDYAEARAKIALGKLTEDQFQQALTMALWMLERLEKPRVPREVPKDTDKDTPKAPQKAAAKDAPKADQQIQRPAGQGTSHNARKRRNRRLRAAREAAEAAARQAEESHAEAPHVEESHAEA